jgi:CDP-diacylglycerol--glycerol-3-phosphate 3-phosphatidyltransferase
VSQSQIPTTPNFSSKVRQITVRWLEQIGAVVHSWGIHPDLITFVGLILTAVAAYFAARGQFVTAALILIIGMPLDALDGAVARAMKRTNPFGGVFDSTLDRYADLFMLLAVAYYFAVSDMNLELALTFAAVVGSSLVSYIRARAGNAGLPCAGGMFSRLERSLVLLVMLLTGWLTIGMAVLAVGSNITALQRLWSVYRFAKESER